MDVDIDGGIVYRDFRFCLPLTFDLLVLEALFKALSFSIFISPLITLN